MPIEYPTDLGFCPKDLTKVVFLEINRLLLPYGEKHNTDYVYNPEKLAKMYKELYDLYDIDYTLFNRYDVTSVYVDWSKSAISNLKNILDTTKAKIVLSSSFTRFIDKYTIYNLFRIQELHKYYIDNTKKFIYEDIKPSIEKLIPQPRKEQYECTALEILQYLYENRQITHFVVLNYFYLNNGIEDHYIKVDNELTADQAQKAIDILQNIPFHGKFGAD
jgi:hypothetical protein